MISSYKCNLCKDTGFVEGNNGVKYCECTIMEMAKKQWNAFGVDPDKVKMINEYLIISDSTKEAKEKAIEYVRDFERIKGCKDNCFALLGNSGAGKTHLAVAIGAALLKKGYRVVYMPYIEAMRELKANALEDSVYNNIIWKYQRADLLVIDDLYKDKLNNGKLDKDKKLNEADIKHLYPILNYRYQNKLPIVVSSEADINVLNTLDEAMGGRIVESCGDNKIVFKGEHHNYRFREWRK